MKRFDSLLLDLESSNSAIRNQAALELMELENCAAVIPLLSAISKPENVNHRGTLIYVLGAFDRRDHFEALVDLVLNGNFEVSTGAFQILADSEFSSITYEKIEAQLHRYDTAQLPFEHSQDAHSALLELISSQRK